MNKFDQLVEDLTEGDLTLTQIQIAIRTSIRRRNNIPDGVKGLLAGEQSISGTNAGLIYKMFAPVQDVIGAIELAYRRGRSNETK